MIYEDYQNNYNYVNEIDINSNNNNNNNDLFADEYNMNYSNCYYDTNHVHEYSESTKLAEKGNERHNHRVSGVTGEAIPINGGRSHVHKINNDNTDSYDHHHRICLTTGPAIEISGTNKHVHLICGKTSIEDNHCHKFLFTTQIEEPLI